MFILVELEDLVEVIPADLDGFRWDSATKTSTYQTLDLREYIKRDLNSRFSDKVVPNVGLAISVREIGTISSASGGPAGSIHRGDGKNYRSQVEFRVRFFLTCFRPPLSSVLDGSLRTSDVRGLTISLGFFENVLVPHKALQPNSHWDAIRHVWVWVDPPGSEANTKLDYVVGDSIRVEVKSLKFATEEEMRASNISMQPLMILGRCDKPGLGMVEWWDEEDDEIEMGEGFVEGECRLKEKSVSNIKSDSIESDDKFVDEAEAAMDADDAMQEDDED